jgi:hypothetical protein
MYVLGDWLNWIEDGTLRWRWLCWLGMHRWQYLDGNHYVGQRGLPLECQRCGKRGVS